MIKQVWTNSDGWLCVQLYTNEIEMYPSLSEYWKICLSPK